MAIKFLLDTNVCIYIIKQTMQSFEERIGKYIPGDIGISSITLAELEFGVAKSERRGQNTAALTQFISPLLILPFDSVAAFHFGEIRLTLERRGRLIEAMDLLIAAHARAVGATLVTNDRKAFRAIPELKVEFWS